MFVAYSSIFNGYESMYWCKNSLKGHTVWVNTVRALFVSAFSQQLTMKMLESPSVAVYVKDDMRNMYYELTDVR